MTTLDERFDIFWKAYPLKVSKKSAKVKWGVIKPDDKLLKVILDKIELYDEYVWGRASKKFIPHPSTFLSKERWADDISDRVDDAKEEDRVKNIEINRPPKSEPKAKVEETDARKNHLKKVFAEGRKALERRCDV